MKVFFWEETIGDEVTHLEISPNTEKLINELTDPLEIMAVANSEFDIANGITDEEEIKNIRQQFMGEADAEEIGSGIIASTHIWEGGCNYLYLSTTGHDELAEMIANEEMIGIQEED